MENKKKYQVWMGVLFTIPLWLPIVYLTLSWVELKFMSRGPLNELGAFALFIAPVIGGIPIFFVSGLPTILRPIIFIFYYGLGLFVAGFIGWGLCMELNICR